MNDPGLDEPISNSANAIQEEMGDEEDAEKEEEQAFLDPRSCPSHMPVCISN